MVLEFCWKIVDSVSRKRFVCGVYYDGEAVANNHVVGLFYAVIDQMIAIKWSMVIAFRLNVNVYAVKWELGNVIVDVDLVGVRRIDNAVADQFNMLQTAHNM